MTRLSYGSKLHAFEIAHCTLYGGISLDVYGITTIELWYCSTQGGELHQKIKNDIKLLNGFKYCSDARNWWNVKISGFLA